MTKEEYENLPLEKKVQPGDIVSFYFPANGSLKENDLVAREIFETMDHGKPIMMVRAASNWMLSRQLDIFKGKAQFNHIASYDLDYVTIQVKVAETLLFDKPGIK